MGDFYRVARALALDGTTPQYTDDRLIAPDTRLNGMARELAQQKGMPKAATSSTATHRICLPSAALLAFAAFNAVWFPMWFGAAAHGTANWPRCSPRAR